MASIVWTSRALSDLAEIGTYIAKFDPVAAQSTAARLLSAGESLADFPNRGRNAGPGVRVLPNVAPYLIYYAVAADSVRILTIRHGRRRTVPA